jgi:hypothetical protein
MGWARHRNSYSEDGTVSPVSSQGASGMEEAAKGQRSGRVEHLTLRHKRLLQQVLGSILSAIETA